MTPHATSLPLARAQIHTGSAADRDHDITGPGELESLFGLVIGRHGRLERLLDMRAPEIVVRNEKRMLRTAVNALLENDEIAATIGHIGFDTFAKYLAYIAGIDFDIPLMDMAAAPYAA